MVYLNFWLILFDQKPSTRLSICCYGDGPQRKVCLNYTNHSSYIIPQDWWRFPTVLFAH